MPFSALAVAEPALTVAKCGAITYTFDETSLPSAVVYDFNGLAIEGVAIDDQNWVGTFTFTVTGQLGNYGTAQSSTITVVIANPCTGTDITVTSFTPALSTTILGADDTFSFPESTDSID